jgi:SAM-dependent methyltransferase/uncharacterized protein YbaR (Trm112 family)
MTFRREKLIETLRCPGCQGRLSVSSPPTADRVNETLVCTRCQEKFPIIEGMPRMLLSPLREALLENNATSGSEQKKVATALSFGFEWSRFPEMYKEWQQTFFAYMQPHGSDFFPGKKVLDAGCGSGRFAYYAAKFGAEVWALDLGPAVDVARLNTEALETVQVVQADLYNPPFAEESFDFIYSIGVLHHLPEPEVAFRNLLRFLRPGGTIQIYLYWKPENQPLKSALLAVITAVRHVTTRLPHALVHVLSYPAAVAAFTAFVWPYQLFSRVPGLRKIAEKLPMKQYASLPFRVCVNDQLDRFSAPIENRYTRNEVAAWLERAGLEQQMLRPNFGWVGSGRKPLALTATG